MTQSHRGSSIFLKRLQRGWQHSDPSFRFANRVMITGFTGSFACLIARMADSWLSFAFAAALLAGTCGRFILEHVRRARRMMEAEGFGSMPTTPQAMAWAAWYSGDFTVKCGYYLLFLGIMLVLLPFFSTESGRMVSAQAQFAFMTPMAGAFALREGRLGKARRPRMRPAPTWQRLAAAAFTAVALVLVACALFVAWCIASLQPPVQIGLEMMFILAAFVVNVAGLCSIVWARLTQNRDSLRQRLTQRRKAAV